MKLYRLIRVADAALSVLWRFVLAGLALRGWLALTGLDGPPATLSALGLAGLGAALIALRKWAEGDWYRRPRPYITPPSRWRR